MLTHWPRSRLLYKARGRCVVCISKQWAGHKSSAHDVSHAGRIQDRRRTDSAFAIKIGAVKRTRHKYTSRGQVNKERIDRLYSRAVILAPGIGTNAQDVASPAR